MQEPPGGWDRAKAGTCVINAASVLPCLEVPDAALADVDAAVATASAAGAKAKVHTGTHGPLGPREHPHKDCRANMMYSTVPLGSSDSLPLGTLTSLVAEELAAQAELLRPNEAGISTGASPSPSPRIRPVSAPPHPRCGRVQTGLATHARCWQPCWGCANANAKCLTAKCQGARPH